MGRGMQLFRVMEQGLLVPDEEVVGLLKDAIYSKSPDAKGFIIDGFPANLEQARLFEEMIGAPTKIIVFELNEEVMKIRLKERSNLMTSQMLFSRGLKHSAHKQDQSSSSTASQS